jgi:hypothetical protein
MLTEYQIDSLMDVFYKEAPHDYTITFETKKRKHVKGACFYAEKVVVIFGFFDYYEALETILHEVAHANIQHRTHSDVWEKELVRLLIKYNFPRDLAGRNTVVGPNERKYIQGVI